MNCPNFLFRTALSNIVVHLGEEVILLQYHLWMKNDMLSDQKKIICEKNQDFFNKYKKSRWWNC